MEAGETVSRIDPLLMPFLMEEDEQQADHMLFVLLMEHADPVITGIVRSTLPATRGWASSPDLDDVKGEIVLRLIERLKAYKSSPDGEIFAEFLSYVAVTAFNVCYSHLRSKYSERWRLKNKIRYVLNHRGDMAIWEAGGASWLCGFDRWHAENRQRCSAGKLDTLSRSLHLLEAGLGDGRSMQRNPAGLVEAVLTFAEGPIELDDLVDLIAGFLGVADGPRKIEAESGQRCDMIELLASGRPLQSDLVESRVSVSVLWKEIRDLPQKQIAALLLSLKDSQGLDAISLLGNARVASLRDIAEVLGVDAAELARMWDELPLNDRTIARHMGITSQQVINLRKSARKRLAYRLRAYAKS